MSLNISPTDYYFHMPYLFRTWSSPKLLIFCWSTAGLGFCWSMSVLGWFIYVTSTLVGLLNPENRLFYNWACKHLLCLGRVKNWLFLLCHFITWEITQLCQTIYWIKRKKNLLSVYELFIFLTIIIIMKWIKTMLPAVLKLNLFIIW